jgi:hypothetical protein
MPPAGERRLVLQLSVSRLRAAEDLPRLDLRMKQPKGRTFGQKAQAAGINPAWRKGAVRALAMLS